MAFAKSNLKLTQVQAVVRCSGTGGDSGSIDIDVDIKKSGETASSPEVNIARVHWNCDKNAAVTITRNSVDIMHVHGTGFTDWYGWVENTENDQDIDIAIANGDAVVWLELSKVSGFGPQDHQNQGTLGGN
jgi:hypothetical protein